LEKCRTIKRIGNGSGRKSAVPGYESGHPRVRTWLTKRGKRSPLGSFGLKYRELLRGSGSHRATYEGKKSREVRRPITEKGGKRRIIIAIISQGNPQNVSRRGGLEGGGWEWVGSGEELKCLRKGESRPVRLTKEKNTAPR